MAKWQINSIQSDLFASLNPLQLLRTFKVLIIVSTKATFLDLPCLILIHMSVYSQEDEVVDITPLERVYLIVIFSASGISENISLQL